MLGEEKGVAGVVVKQLVPRGSADRTGSVGVGDQLLIVGEEDVSQQTVGNMRHLIIGDMGSYCNVTFRSAASGQVYSVQLQRGTPEFLDQLVPRDRGSHASLNPGEMRADAGGAGAAAAGDGRATLQEEADWLRSALRLAETHVRKDREELKSLHAIFERNEIDTGRRIQNLEERLEERDAERRGLEGRLWNAEEKVRALETKLSEAARREEFHNEEARKVYENEQQRLEFIQELKRHFEDEKRSLESELVRMHDGLRVERAARVEAEAVSEQLRQEVQRIQEQHMHALRVNREGADRLKEQTEKIREISRANSALTIMLSEIQPRLTVLEQDVFSSRLPSEAEGRWNTAGNTLSAAPLRHS